MRPSVRIMGGGLAALLAALGCGGHAGEGVLIGGETNWLATCSVDSDCSVGSCLCNVCTIRCTETAACDGGPPVSSCVTSELPSSCGQSLSAGLCLASDTRVGGALSSAELPAPVTPLDASLTQLLSDLEAQPVEAQPHTRYVSIANLGHFYPTDWQEFPYLRAFKLELDRGRASIAKLVNSLSSAPVATAPVNIDGEGLIFRIDLRSYGWDRPISVDGVSYRDGWEAIASRATLALRYRGPAADALVQRSGSTLPLLFGNDLAVAATSGNLYYELLGVPPTLAALQAELEQGQSSAPVLQRAALDSSDYAVARGVERRALADGRTYWQAFSYADPERGANVFEPPFDLVPDETEVIFPLPNGSYGFYLADARGDRLVASRIQADGLYNPSQPYGGMRNGISCFQCHSDGLVSFTHRLLEGGRDPRQSDLVEYLTAPQLDQALGGDNAAYAQAAELAGAGEPVVEGVSALYLDFLMGMVSQGVAAAELFTTREQLSERAPRLPGELSLLDRRERHVTRDLFVPRYLEAMCALHSSAWNQPASCP